MDKTKVLILGGYGNTGRLIARLLLEQTEAHLTLAGRSLAKAQALAAELNARFNDQRVTAQSADASDPESLKTAMQAADLVIVASSTSQFTSLVAQAALAVRMDYYDILFSSTKLAALQSLSSQIEAAGCCFVTDGGFHPGLPAAMVRYAAREFERLSIANVGSVIKVDWAGLDVGDETVKELLSEFMSFRSLVYQQGCWQDAGIAAMVQPLSMDFGREFGRQYCVPMFLEEMRCLPDLYPGLEQTGFYVGGFNWFVDWIITPLALVALKILPGKTLRPMARWMRWGLNTFSKPPYGTLLKAEISGTRQGKAQRAELSLYHADGYLLTAIPVVACLKQILDGSARRPGLWLQAHIAEPERLMRDMSQMGVNITER
jgi:saccharopine dehydrogenase (NAD+, L-lysine-forming)